MYGEQMTDEQRQSAKSIVYRAIQREAIRDAELAIQRAYKRIVSLPELPERVLRETSSKLLEALVSLNACCVEIGRTNTSSDEDVPCGVDRLFPEMSGKKTLSHKNGVSEEDGETSQEEQDDEDYFSTEEESSRESDSDESQRYDEF